ncbi:MAG TPA: nucleoside monophosphate kinase, partial [Propionibacteriaceae bacterium]|nr:nucleoside monophosphate kinase [Propionibacteriaceae bacterium]
SIFRKNIREGTELGLRVKELIDAGDFVPDVVTSAVVANRLMEPDCDQGFLLDGYPRTVAQVEALDLILTELCHELDCVLSLVGDDDHLVARLLHRAELENRPDDNEQTIRHRMDVYHHETEPLFAIYRERGMLLEVNGEGDIDEVAARIIAALDGVVEHA